MMRDRVLTVNRVNCFLEPEGTDFDYPRITLHTVSSTFNRFVGFKDSNIWLAECAGMNERIEPINPEVTWEIVINSAFKQGAFRNLYLWVQYGVGARANGNG